MRIVSFEKGTNACLMWVGTIANPPAPPQKNIGVVQFLDSYTSLCDNFADHMLSIVISIII